ncbi:MAG: iron response transcriptional regulator IrrA [Alphaproteobacteria bacterium]
MTEPRPFAAVLAQLKSAGLRPTKQRLALSKLLFEGGNRHITAEQLHVEARGYGVIVSLATVYNALHQFTASGLLREVIVDAGRSYFDTNVDDHHHLFYIDEGRLEDISHDVVGLAGSPVAPAGCEIERVEVIIRVRRKD